MQVLDTPLRDVKLILPKVFGDDRGWFTETFSKRAFAKAGLPSDFVQDNQSFSRRGVLRGIHYQVEHPQGKLVRALSGHIWDVAVDLRRDSPDFGKWAGFDLTESQLQYLWIPQGFGHGFVVLSETASVAYKTTDFYFPQGERCIRWDDATLKINWPIEGLEVNVSSRDVAGVSFADADLPIVEEPAHAL